MRALTPASPLTKPELRAGHTRDLAYGGGCSRTAELSGSLWDDDTNSSTYTKIDRIRMLGGVFGVAVLAAVFAAYGGYAGAAEFVDGFRPAIWVAASVPLAGVAAAALAPGKNG